MARKTKEELLEEAHELGVEADAEENYNDIFERVSAARESQEEVAEQVPLDPETDERTTSGWNALGQWVGIAR